MSTNPVQTSSDSLPGAAAANPVTEVSSAATRLWSYYNNKALADVNAADPAAINSDGTRSNPVAPTPLKRQMGAPLKKSGPYTDGRGNRLVTSLPGEARSVGYGNNVDSNRRHMGLDFKADVGEDVFATADGIVTFIGCQRRNKSRISMEAPEADSGGNVKDAHGSIVNLAELGHGGLYVQLTHNGDFFGYKSEFMHLSKVPASLKIGSRVNEGDLIGYVGRTGGNSGITSGAHLHFQVRAGGQIVLPQQFVAFYVPGRQNPSATVDPVSSLLSTSIGTKVPAGVALAAGQGISYLQGFSRAHGVENLQPSDIKQLWGSHSQTQASAAAVKAASLMRVVAAFQQAPAAISSPMTFDFTTGLWNDGKAV